jgi:protein-disulfide isomerase
MLTSSTSRRAFLELAAAAGVAASGVTPALAQNVALKDLLADQALPDVWEGKADAPVTIIEYASMTCGHCAHFHQTTFPILKSKYIDTGKVRFTLREFPLNPPAVAGFMLARCSGDKRGAMIGLLFAQLDNWAADNNILQNLSKLVRQTGMSEEAFNTCLADRDLYAKVTQVYDTAAKKYGVNATPTFFINGQRVSGAMTPDELDKQLAPLLKG